MLEFRKRIQQKISDIRPWGLTAILFSDEKLKELISVKASLHKKYSLSKSERLWETWGELLQRRIQIVQSRASCHQRPGDYDCKKSNPLSFVSDSIV